MPKMARSWRKKRRLRPIESSIRSLRPSLKCKTRGSKVTWLKNHVVESPSGSKVTKKITWFLATCWKVSLSTFGISEAQFDVEFPHVDESVDGPNGEADIPEEPKFFRLYVAIGEIP